MKREQNHAFSQVQSLLSIMNNEVDISKTSTTLIKWVKELRAYTRLDY